GAGGSLRPGDIPACPETGKYGVLMCPRLEHGNRCDFPGSGKSCNNSNTVWARPLRYSAACSLSGPLPGLCMTWQQVPGTCSVPLSDPSRDAEVKLPVCSRVFLAAHGPEPA